MSQPNDTRNWPELAIGLYDRLTERNAEIVYDFDNMQVGVPSSTSSDAPVATWKVHGTMRITTRNGAER